MLFVELEKTLEQFPHTINAFGALGTFLAVVVSLYIANKKTQAKVSADLEVRKLPEVLRDQDLIIASVTNHGPYTIYLHKNSCFEWEFKFSSVTFRSTNSDIGDLFKHGMIEIVPNKTIGIVISKNCNGYFDNFLKCYKGNLSGIKKLIFQNTQLKNIDLKFMSLYMVASDRQKVKVKIGSNFKKKIEQYVNSY